MHKPQLFLQRYGEHLTEDHLAYFDHLREENYEVDFYLKAVRQSQCRFVKEQLVRNRRYRAMQQMIRYRLLIFTGNFSGIMPNFLKIC